MDSAKYIEGLENRLGRMESLLKLSGLLPNGDDSTDLGDLERRLQESAAASASPSQKAPSNAGGSGGSSGGPNGIGSSGGPSSSSAAESVRGTPSSTLQSNLNSPVAPKDEPEVETLSDQLCSLVTNHCGETRFIGIYCLLQTWDERE